MKAWIFNHQKLLTTSSGIFFLLLTFLLFFWTAPKEVSSQSPMQMSPTEKRMNRHNSNVIKREAKPDMSKIVNTLQQRKAQGRMFLLVLLVIGLGLIIYSFFIPSKRKTS